MLGGFAPPATQRAAGSKFALALELASGRRGPSVNLMIAAPRPAAPWLLRQLIFRAARSVMNPCFGRIAVLRLGWLFQVPGCGLICNCPVKNMAQKIDLPVVIKGGRQIGRGANF